MTLHIVTNKISQSNLQSPKITPIYYLWVIKKKNATLYVSDINTMHRLTTGWGACVNGAMHEWCHTLMVPQVQITASHSRWITHLQPQSSKVICQYQIKNKVFQKLLSEVSASAGLAHRTSRSSSPWCCPGRSERWPGSFLPSLCFINIRGAFSCLYFSSLGLARDAFKWGMLKDLCKWIWALFQLLLIFSACRSSYIAAIFIFCL